MVQLQYFWCYSFILVIVITIFFLHSTLQYQRISLPLMSSSPLLIEQSHQHLKLIWQHHTLMLHIFCLCAILVGPYQSFKVQNNRMLWVDLQNRLIHFTHVSIPTTGYRLYIHVLLHVHG